MTISCHSDNDSINLIFPKLENEEITDMLREPVYSGDIYEAFSMLREGEEAEFVIRADSFFGMGGREIPPMVKSENVLFFKIKLNEVKTREEYEQEMAVKEQEYLESLEQEKEKEKPALEKYLAEQKITVKPTTSGLYYIETLKGKGAKAESGKQVTVHYTGKFLDGTVFDSSVERGRPMEFVIGLQPMIQGFTEGVLLMREGGKATLIIPSEIAYSDGGGRFPPYVSLIFEIELVKVSEPAKESESPFN